MRPGGKQKRAAEGNVSAVPGIPDNHRLPATQPYVYIRPLDRDFLRHDLYAEVKIGFASVAPLQGRAENPPTTLTPSTGATQAIIKAPVAAMFGGSISGILGASRKGDQDDPLQSPLHYA